MAPVVRSRQSRGRDRCSQLDTTLIGRAVAYCQRQGEALAEGVGFEPTGHPRRPTVFKTVAFNRSATPPAVPIVRRGRAAGGYCGKDHKLRSAMFFDERPRCFPHRGSPLVRNQYHSTPQKRAVRNPAPEAIPTFRRSSSGLIVMASSERVSSVTGRGPQGSA